MERRCSGILGFAGFGASSSQFSIAPYKRIPMHPLISPAVDLFHSNQLRLKSSCEHCFPEETTGRHGGYVDLLDFSLFDGVPWPLGAGVKKPSRWFADIRYTLSTPLPHTYPRVQDEVIHSDRVASVITQELAANSTLTVASLKKKAAMFFLEMKASLSKVVCKACAWILFKVFRRLMTHLLICPEEMKRLKEAEDTGIPIVYLPLHRSHLDYLLITWSAWHFGLKLPHIASGDNLNLSGFGWLLRATGAFFIRRRIDPSVEVGKDALYRAVLHSYLEQLMKSGLNIEFFLEGTRNRFGKCLSPKNGLISNVVEAVQQGIIPDCYMVPVSYTYDQVAEGVFLNELMGIPKVRESLIGVFRGLLKGFQISKRCGAVRMHYGKPVLLTDYLESLSDALAKKTKAPSQLTALPHSFSYRELVPWHREHEQKTDNRSLIRAIGFHIVYEAQAMASISLVSVVSSLLICKFREGVYLDVLSSDAQWLCEEILDEGRDVMGWHDRETCGQSVVEYALPYIRNSVERRDDFVSPILSHRQLINLAYNKNSLISAFAIKSAVALTLLTRPAEPVSEKKLVEEVLFLCDLLQFEILFCKPCDSLRERIHDALGKDKGGMSRRNGLLRREEEDHDGFGDANDLDSILEVIDERAHDVLVFFANLIRPFVQSMYLVTGKLIEKEFESVTETEFIRNLCKQSLRSRPDKFQPVLEAINSDSFRNGLRLLRHKGLLSAEGKPLMIFNHVVLESMNKQMERYI